MLAAHFLYDQLHPDTLLDDDIMPPASYYVDEQISVFSSAVATYYAPSDLSGIGGMHHEYIRATSL